MELDDFHFRNGYWGPSGSKPVFRVWLKLYLGHRFEGSWVIIKQGACKTTAVNTIFVTHLNPDKLNPVPYLECQGT